MNTMQKDILSYLEKIIEEEKEVARSGEIPDYIEAVDNDDHGAVSVALTSIDGTTVRAGDYEGRFSLQSIAKLFPLALALMDHGSEEVFKYTGKAPTGNVYHSLIQMEMQEKEKPLNPMVNSGAIVMCGLMKGTSADEKFERILTLARELTGNKELTYNEKVYQAENQDLNRSLFYYNRHNGYIEGEFEDVMPVYWKMTSIEVTIEELSNMAAVIANYGTCVQSGKELLPPDVVTTLKSFMVTCGMYDESGAFAVEVGIPAKSGVSGSIIAAIPGKLGIGVMGPDLNKYSNSIAGIRMLKKISDKWQLSIFSKNEDGKDGKDLKGNNGKRKELD
ncbi:glutaminase A [Alkalicoccobacillus porphyridii]|uniref:Glutaminase n=1 Tax=Alkalicoccobacillus porphyridii TaxID=2597270 RepID=A0A553ZUW1_9BACI|nr:glutaminase A [Alkalicoccobacillus porphyridii]TSB45274.1 glutaminase A [Alkalicoccobacillus porphyridii]